MQKGRRELFKVMEMCYILMVAGGYAGKHICQNSFNSTHKKESFYSVSIKYLNEGFVICLKPLSPASLSGWHNFAWK